MDDLVQRMREEEADLTRKLEAVRAFIAAYDVKPSGPKQEPMPRQHVFYTHVSSVNADPDNTGRGRERVSLDRFSPYGSTIVKAAMAAIRSYPTRPVATRTLVDLIESDGVEVRGTDKVNALSALLARSLDLKSIGRRGWMLAGETDGQEPKENEPLSGDAGGSETEVEGAANADPSEGNH